MRRWLAGVLVVGCAGRGTLGEQTSGVVYGADDRHDVHAGRAPRVREQTKQATLALIPPTQLRFRGDQVELGAPSLSDWDDYCEGTPFLDQPTAAACSAVLVDDDLVLTARHCLEGVTSCRDLAYVFDYLYAEPDELALRGRESVFGCLSVVLQELSAPDSEEQLDFAFIQLDRPSGREPALTAALRALAAGEPLTVVGTPQGLPVKIDAAARVFDPRPAELDYFRLSSDTFVGSSGSPVYDAANELVGVFAHGTGDVVGHGSCRALRRLDEASEPNESATYAARAVAALCASGWPSPRLCQIEPTCGDGVCTSAATSPESNASCPEDCRAPTCGDSLCEASEWSDCELDCGDRRPNDLPRDWYCEPLWFADGETCDCNCGAPDPDCASSAESACESLGPAGRSPTPEPAVLGSNCSIGRSPQGGASLLSMVCAALVRRRRAFERSRRGNAGPTAVDDDQKPR